MTRVDLAILIVSYNTRLDLERCLGSLHQNPPNASHEIVVIDNASSDGSVGAVRAQWPHVRIIALERNQGFGPANNEGFRQTASDLVLLLNSDTVVPAAAIDHLVTALRQLPDAAVVGPKLIDANGHPELSFGKMVGPFGELRQKAIVRLGGRKILGRLTSQTRVVDWVSAACLLVSRHHAEAAGLFDDRYFMYLEDVDFCAAIRANGGKIYFTPSAEVVHLRGRSGAFNRTETDMAYRRSQLAFYRKHHPGWAPLLRLYLALKGTLPPD
jgi:GT2 family glycosyltransferase